MDEAIFNKADNVFIMRVPIDSKSMKKMLVLLKKHYDAYISNQLTNCEKISSELTDFNKRFGPTTELLKK